MAEPITVSAAALAIAHFVGEHGMAHLIGGEIHHFYRQFLERWRESPTDSKTGLPHNHDLEDAGAESLRAALLVLVMELAGRIEPKKSWLSRWAERLPGGGLLARDIFPGASDPHRRWLDGLRNLAHDDHVRYLYRTLKLEEDQLRRCFDEGNVCKALGSAFTDAIVEWARFELSTQTEHPDFEAMVREGWEVAASSGHRITLGQAYCLFFREHLKNNSNVFRILIADTLGDVRSHLRSLGGNVTAELQSLREKLDALAPNNFASLKTYFTDFQAWLDPQLGEIKNLLAGVQTQLDAHARGQDALGKQQGEILVALTTLRMELARGNLAAGVSLGEFASYLLQFERKLDYLIGGLPIQRFELPDSPTHELQLLHTKHRAVDLVGRDTDLGALWQWLASDAAISARLLIGGAGTGKTRLALELLLRVNGDLPAWQASLILVLPGISCDFSLDETGFA
jgi:hypothetical protein